MRLSRSVPAVVLSAALLVLAALLARPARLSAQDETAAPPSPSVNEPEYQQREEQRRRERERREREKMHDVDPCPGCGRRQEGIRTLSVPGTTLSAVVHDVDVKDGVLTVRLRFYNDGEESAPLVIDPSAYESFFVQAGEERLHILKDDDGDLQAKKRIEVDLRPGKMESWWARFPAPPAGTETFALEIPPAPRFEDLPLDD